MLLDANIGGSVDGTCGASLLGIERQVTRARRCRLDGVWTTEVSRDPFLPLALAARADDRLQLGTAVAVAFARSPLTTAAAANDLQQLSSGRFTLGLGSQVKAHVTRRFSMPWSPPAARMREYVLALRAIWRSWEDGTPLAFEGEHYTHTLMPPLFRPEPHPFGPPPVVVAAVGPDMTRAAAEVADGLLVHAFTTPRYLEEVTLRLVTAELTRGGRSRSGFTVCLPLLVATGADEADLDAAVHAVRRQIAFYAATPAYRPVLDLHGWGGLHDALHPLSQAGDWDAMTSLVEDEVLHAFAVIGAPAQIGPELHRRVGATVDRCTLFTPYPVADEVLAEVVTGARQPAEALA